MTALAGAHFVDHILRGSKLADVLVQAPVKHRTILNLSPTWTHARGLQKVLAIERSLRRLEKREQ